MLLCLSVGPNPCVSCIPKPSNIDILFGNTSLPTPPPYISPKSAGNDIAESISTAYDTMDTLAGVDSGIYMNTNHYLINSAPSVSENFGKAVSVGLIGFETATGVYNNYLDGATTGKIIWDATVDVAVLSSTTWCTVATGTAVGAKYGSLISPGIGTAYGAAGGFVAGILFSLFSDDAIKYLKGLVN